MKVASCFPRVQYTLVLLCACLLVYAGDSVLFLQTNSYEWIAVNGDSFLLNIVFSLFKYICTALILFCFAKSEYISSFDQLFTVLSIGVVALFFDFLYCAFWFDGSLSDVLVALQEIFVFKTLMPYYWPGFVFCIFSPLISRRAFSLLLVK